VRDCQRPVLERSGSPPKLLSIKNSTMKNRDILISGREHRRARAGLWLLHYGFNPTLMERAAALRPGQLQSRHRGRRDRYRPADGLLDDVRRLHADMRGDLSRIRKRRRRHLRRRFATPVRPRGGADGLHSSVRALVFGDESRFAHSLGCYLSIVTGPNRLEVDSWEMLYNMFSSLDLDLDLTVAAKMTWRLSPGQVAVV
jgi:hypothetical protein